MLKGHSMITIRNYPERILAELDKTLLESAGFRCEVSGLGVAWDGGISGIELKVEASRAEEAIALLTSATILSDDPDQE